MTKKQIEWAKKHDWYVDTSADNDAVLVKENGYRAEFTWFDNIDELRAWAGY